MQRVCIFSVLAMIGCAASPTPAPETATTVPAVSSASSASSASLEKSADSGQVDRVGSTDGALAPDGTNDWGFVAKTDGPISALFLVVVDESGKPSGTFQADTLVGAAESPPELGA